MKVAILGSGFSGIFSALACIHRGVSFDIYSDNLNKPRAIGFQYLHDKCNLDLVDHELDEFIIGEGNDYSYKIYGNNYSSIVDVVGKKTIYSLDEAANKVWSLICSNITYFKISGYNSIKEIINSYDYVISSVPLYFIAGDKYEHRDIFCYTKLVSLYFNYVIYNGISTDSITRVGCVFHNIFMESLLALPNMDGFSCHVLKKVITKEVKPNIADNILLIGRYGSWNKKYLIHNSYYETLRIIDEKRV